MGITPVIKTHGKRSLIPAERWEEAMFQYRFKDRPLREVAKELERDHSTVIRMFQGMERREPSILERIGEKFAPGSDQLSGA